MRRQPVHSWLTSEGRPAALTCVHCSPKGFQRLKCGRYHRRDLGRRAVGTTLQGMVHPVEAQVAERAVFLQRSPDVVGGQPIQHLLQFGVFAVIARL
jgi:hypothetical protein